MYEAKQCKKKISRGINANGCGIRQRFMTNSNRTIQCHMGKKTGDIGFVCSCTSDVYYKSNGKIKHSEGTGGNDGNSKSEVLNIFINHGLMALKNIPEKQNPPGQCAEPHSVADALRKIPKKADVLNIKVSDAKKANGLVKPRCTTCKQWIENYKVEKSLLRQKW